MNNSPTAPGSSRFPTFARVLRWLFNWRTLGRVMVGLAVLATLIALACAEEHWRGKWAWQHYKRQLEAQGEKLDWKAFIPPPVPDDQNFAMTPLLAPLYDFNPGPLAVGQSPWRDTNGYNRVASLGAQLGNFDGEIARPNARRTLQRMTDLQAWALALTGKPYAAPNVAAQGAAEAAFRRRYGLEKSAREVPMPVPAMEQSPGPRTNTAAEQEAFRQRYGLSNPVVPVPGAVPVVDQPSAPLTNTPALTRPEAAAEVLQALKQYDPGLDELRSASRRPSARFNIRYEEGFASAILLPHLAVVKRFCLMFQLRASAELALGQADQAWADTQMALYLGDTLKNEPFLISKLVELATVEIALRPIWEGLAEHKWSDAQLAEIEQRLARLDLLADAALRGERAMSLLTVDQLRHTRSMDPDDPRGSARFAVFPLGGFFYQNELFIARMYQQYFVPVVDAANQRLYPSRAAADEGALTDAMAGGFPPYHFFAKVLLPALGSAPTKLGFGQTLVNEAIVACALERYRLAQGQFPDSLEPLCPRFLEKMPHDLITGAPLKYRRTPDGQFILYSVGWNERDDGGEVVLPQTNANVPERKPGWELTEGDWVWQYPTHVTAAPAGRAAGE